MLCRYQSCMCVCGSHRHCHPFVSPTSCEGFEAYSTVVKSQSPSVQHYDSHTWGTVVPVDFLRHWRKFPEFYILRSKMTSNFISKFLAYLLLKNISCLNSYEIIVPYFILSFAIVTTTYVIDLLVPGTIDTIETRMTRRHNTENSFFTPLIPCHDIGRSNVWQKLAMICVFFLIFIC